MIRCDRCCCFHVRGSSYSAWCSGVIAAVVFTCVVPLILHDVPVWSLLLFSRAWVLLFCLMFRCDRCCCFHVRGASYSAWCSGVIAAVVFTCVVHLILADDPVWSLLLFSRAWCLLFCLMFRCDRCCCFHVRGASDSSWWSGVIVAVVFTCVVHLILTDVPVWSLLFVKILCYNLCCHVYNSMASINTMDALQRSSQDSGHAGPAALARHGTPTWNWFRRSVVLPFGVPTPTEGTPSSPSTVHSLPDEVSNISHSTSIPAAGRHNLIQMLPEAILLRLK